MHGIFGINTPGLSIYVHVGCLFVCLFVVALRPKSTAMVMAGRSVLLTTLFLGNLEQAVTQYFVHIGLLSLVTDNKRADLVLH